MAYRITNVRIFDGNTNLSITNNNLITGVFHGIRLSDPEGVPTDAGRALTARRSSTATAARSCPAS